MELIILLKLEGYIREAGLTNVRISEMFDLIIGTSTGLRLRYARTPTSSRTNILTGGIIALGIGQCQWATVDALKKFIDVAERVFTPRVGVQIPIWKRAAKYLYSYIYQTSEAEKVFKEIFSDDLLFNGPGSSLSPIKVAVAVCEDSGQVRLLSNYSRPFSYEDGMWTVSSSLQLERLIAGADGHECLVRPDKPEDEIKIWEALVT